MFVQFSVAACLIAATVAIQALFMSIGLRTFKWIEKHQPTMMARWPTMITVIWVLFLLIPIILDVILWATFYYAQAALPSFEEALYFSTVTFTTVGYGDIVLSREWRQLATSRRSMAGHLRVGDRIDHSSHSAAVFPSQ